MLLRSAFLCYGLLQRSAAVTADQDTDANKAVVEEYVSRVNSRDFDNITSLFTSPLTVYWINGSPARNSNTGNSTVEKRFAGVQNSLGVFDDFSFTITPIAGDGDLVITEVLAQGRGPGTLYYRQTAVLSFRVRDGKLDYMRECIDYEEAQYLATYLERLPDAPSCA